MSCSCSDLHKLIGRVCDDAGRTRVILLNFAYPLKFTTLFRGRLPSAPFLQLPYLLEVNFEGHLLSGPLPPAFWAHPTLEYAFLAGNKFTGTFPKRALPPALSGIDARYNLLTGSLPSELCSVSALSVDGNAGLCDRLPNCFTDRNIIDTTLNTGLAAVQVRFCLFSFCVSFSGCSFLGLFSGCSFLDVLLWTLLFGRCFLGVLFWVLYRRAGKLVCKCCSGARSGREFCVCARCPVCNVP